jgi:hypothetical protein
MKTVQATKAWDSSNAMYANARSLRTVPIRLRICHSLKKYLFKNKLI